MKLTAAFLVLGVALLSHSTAAFFMGKPVVPTIPMAPTAPALVDKANAVAETGASTFFKGFNPLKFILASLGIPVDHLVEGSRKCVAELGPESVWAVKSLLGALTFFG